MGVQSSLTRAVAVLAAEVKLAHRIARGDAYAIIEERLEEVATHLAHRAWETKRSPSSGRPWRPGTTKGRGDLFETGNLFKSVGIEERNNGFAITIRAHASGGKLYGGTHQYGRTIRAKGFDPKRYASAYKGIRIPMGGRWRKGGLKSGFGITQFGKERALKMRAMRNAQGKFEYTTAPGTKPLMRSTMKVRIPARAMLPKAGQLPADWEEAFTREITKWIMRYGGRFYTAGSPDVRG